MIEKIKSRVFQKIHTGNLVYNTCWEDPRCDRAILELNQDSRVVMLTSAGCNALDYLLDSPASIDCVDMNPRQNALLDLKSSLFRTTDHETLFRFFGHGRHEDANAVFKAYIQPDLETYAQGYWSKNLHFFNGSGIRNSFYWYGSAGSAAFMVKKILEANPRTKRLIQRFFESKDLETQRALYEQIEPRLINAFTAWLFNRHVFQSMLGVPESQQNLAKKTYPDGMAGYLKQCFRKVFSELSVADNYFWKVYLQGQYSTSCCPNYLRKTNFDTLKNRVDRLKTHTATLSQFLEQNPGQYTHFVLLDHQDWMAANAPDALQTEWQLILQNSAPNAKILLRSAATEVDFIPEPVYEKVTFDQNRVTGPQRLDRVGTYASTMLGVVNA